jgi:hypothetical protein
MVKMQTKSLLLGSGGRPKNDQLGKNQLAKTMHDVGGGGEPIKLLTRGLNA